MKGKRTTFGTDACAIARAVDAIGDWWSLLIVRDALGGKRRFGEFQKSLGLAKNILTVRLRKLVDAGILVIEPASDGSAYKEYVLTEKGERLHVTMVALWQWGEDFAFSPNETAPRLMDVSSRTPLPPLRVVGEDRQTLGPREIGLMASGDPLHDARATRATVATKRKGPERDA